MEEELKKLMGDAYKADMTSDEIQTFFKNQVLGGGEYVRKEKADADLKKVQDALNAKDADLKSRMTDDEKKAAASQAIQEELESLRKQVADGNISRSQLKAISTTAKTRINAGIEDNDNEFSEFITSISTEDEAKTSKVANYINKIVELAYNKGKTDATKNSLGRMGNLNSADGDNQDGKTEAEQRAERLAKSLQTVKPKNSYFK